LVNIAFYGSMLWPEFSLFSFIQNLAMNKFLIFLAVILSSCLSLCAQNDRFYSSLEGLSGTTMHGFTQDSKGFLWIPTESGLNRFDGYNFKVYFNQPGDSSSINSSSSYAVFEDSSGRLWVGTNLGFNSYNYEQDCFKLIPLEIKGTSISLTVKSILEDNKKMLWLITSHGLVHFDPKTKKYDFYNHHFRDDGTPYHSKYNQAVFDAKGNLWIGTDDNSVLIFDTQKYQFYSIREYTGINYEFPDRTVLVVNQTKSGQIYFGTQRAGLILFDPRLRSFQQAGYSSDPENLLDGGIYSIIIDRRGTVWMGTEHNGLKIYNPGKNTFTDANHLIDIPNVRKAKFYCFEDNLGDMWFGIQYRGIYHKISSVKPFHSIGNSKEKVQELSHFIVKAILRDSKDNLWVGTDGGGLNVKWKGSKDFVLFKSASKGVALNDKAIICLHEDRHGRIWIGTYLEGLFCYQGKDKVLVNYKIPGSDKENWNNYIFDIKEDAAGNLWIGTNGGGLFYLNIKNGAITDKTHPVVGGKTETIKPFVNALEYDKDSTLWIGTYNGLFCWNMKKETFRALLASSGDIANDIIFSIVKDQKNRIWFGTLAGLYCYNPENKKNERLSTDNGLCDNGIMAIEMDHSNNLWISTSAGISKLNAKTGTFQNYYVYDGLPCNEFRPGASFKDKDGTIYFGGTDGLVYFNPDSINNNPVRPNLIFTSLKIFNQEIKYNQKEPNGILRKDINETDTIVLKYSHQSFTIEFAAINFSVPEKIKYAVQLEGFNSRWDYKDYKQRYASYTNLNPGTYFLNVKSTNLDGQWIDQPRKLCIIVKPPYWSTWWAFLVYTIILISIIYYIRRIALFRISMKNELHLEHVEREKLEEINQSKMQFFTNVSHEIRTPLTMLLGPIERLLESNPSESQKKNINYIYRNTKRLERIVNQLLELQKIENTQLKLKAREIDLVKFLKDIISLFEESATDKNIHLSFEPHCDELMVWIDPDKMDKVVFNLISNAFKFTLTGGLITISINKNRINSEEGTFIISVSDTGKGMDQKHLERIFDRFYQIENKETGQITGTGIGLHLSKELVEKQNGKISVISREGFGSTFTITMPLGKKHLAPDEIYLEQNMVATYVHYEKPDKENNEMQAYDNEPEDHQDSEGTLILIIEDDLDILNYLEDELSVDYKVIKANNGTDGWKLAFERTPDLIVSDIMMPGIDGLQLCKKVKSTIETSHIPVILLTAKTSVEHEIEGLEIGADEYVHKPFHPRLLKLKVDKIIEARELLKQQFTKNISFTAKEMTVTSADEKFLQKAIDFVKENLADADLNIEKLSNELSISRVHLYRKLKAITNQNPTEFIRTIRLKQAAYLLSQGKLNVSEIAYMVGFNSHQYFTNSFQKYFNMSPTEYSRKVENE
jgi:signal transduction histidine kinase/ligand-binding sensor domain-containing protein/AraC-like DNA-binding protein